MEKVTVRITKGGHGIGEVGDTMAVDPATARRWCDDLGIARLNDPPAAPEPESKPEPEPKPDPDPEPEPEPEEDEKPEKDSGANVDLTKLTADELKELCRANNLAVNGTKAKLIERLSAVN